jgi:hypothetical protein
MSDHEINHISMSEHPTKVHTIYNFREKEEVLKNESRPTGEVLSSLLILQEKQQKNFVEEVNNLLQITKASNMSTFYERPARLDRTLQLILACNNCVKMYDRTMVDEVRVN